MKPQIEHPEFEPTRVKIPLVDGYAICDVNDIYYFQSKGNHTSVAIKGQGMVDSVQHLGFFEKSLDGFPFFKTHRTSIVNSRHIRKYIRTDHGRVMMSNGEEVKVAHEIKDKLIEFLRLRRARLNVLCVSSLSEFLYVETFRILYLTSRKPAEGFTFGVHIVLEEAEKLSSTRNIGHFKKELSFDPFFYEVNASSVINMNKVERFFRGNGYWVLMKDEMLLSVSPNKKDKLLSFYDR